MGVLEEGGFKVKRFILAYNPLSGDGRFKYRLDQVIDRFQSAGCLAIPYRIQERNQNQRIVELAQELAIDGIVVSGGDGTVHEIVNLVVANKMNVPLGILPSGTSNDFAVYLQLGRSIEAWVSVVIAGKTRLVDVGKVNDRYFFNVASAGLLSSVAHSADIGLKNTLGKMAYYLKGLGELPNFRSLPLRITADGMSSEEDVLLFLVTNSSTVAGFPSLAPHAKIDDGLLDMIAVRRCSLPELMTLFLHFLKGSHHSSKHLIYLQAKELQITCQETVESDLDGERGPDLPLKITTIPAAIQVFCP